MKAQEPGNEGKQHVQHWEVNIGAGVHLATVALSIETVDNVPREEPEAKVFPGDYHGSVNESLEVDVSDIYSQLENGHWQIGHIVYQHHNATLREHVQGVREEDQWPGHQMVKHVLGEVGTVAVEHNWVNKLVEVIGKLEYIKVVQVRRDAQARIVLIVERLIYISSKVGVQEVTVFLKEYFIQQSHDSNVDD